MSNESPRQDEVDEPIPQLVRLPEPRALTARERSLVDFLLATDWAPDGPFDLTRIR